MTTTEREQLVVYSDYVCPFCYLGKAAMEQYRERADDPPPVEWRFFDLRGYKRRPDGSIDHDVEDGKDEDYFAQARENVERLKERYGVEMTLDFSLEVDSWNAQQVALYVREAVGEDAFRRLHERLFDELWQEGTDVGDPDELRRIAADVGLDADVVENALTEAYENRLRERFEAAQNAGVSGIPTFVYDDHAARGAIPPEQFERLVGDVAVGDHQG